MTLLTKSLTCLFLVFSCSLFSQEGNDALFYLQKGKVAYHQKDLDDYLRNLKRAYNLRPDHPDVLRGLAKAYALKDSINQSFSLLNRIWEMGLILNISEEKDFNSLRNDPRYPSFVKRFSLNNLPLYNSDTSFVIQEKGFIAGGIAFNPNTKLFYLSNVQKGTILVIKEGKLVKELPGIKNEGSILGMKIDIHKKVLWLCASFLPEYPNFNDSLKRISSIIKYDLLNEVVLKRYFLESKEEMYLFDDVTINQKGELFATDSKSAELFKIPKKKTAALEKLDVFDKENKPYALQGLCFSKNGRYLFVADYLKGIYRIDVKKNVSRTLTHPSHITTVGIDGLYFHKGDLIAIQNGIEPNRIIRLNLNKDLSTIESQIFLEANHPAFAKPTLGVIDRNFFYFIASSKGGIAEKEENQIYVNNLNQNIVLMLNLKPLR